MRGGGKKDIFRHFGSADFSKDMNLKISHKLKIEKRKKHLKKKQSSNDRIQRSLIIIRKDRG